MPIIKWLLFASFVIGSASAQAGDSAKPSAPPESGLLALTSTAFADGGEIPAKYTRMEETVSPPLAWSNVPPGTKSFFVHVHDLDTPQPLAYRKSSPTRVHWLVWNIPASATGLPEGMVGEILPDGSCQVGFKGPVYFGPGPDHNFISGGGPVAVRPGRPLPPGHRYRFELWALDIVLDVKPGKDADKTRAEIVVAMNGHVLDQALYTGMFTPKSGL